jgi:Rrf2 family protein
VKVSAKADYALRAALELALAEPNATKGERLSQNQGIPQKFMENILLELKRAEIVETQRGSEGGYRLARPASAVTLADVIRAVDGPLAAVRGRRPESGTSEGAATHLREVWVAVRASLRSVLETVTLADVARGPLPPTVAALLRDPDAWRPH